MAVVSVNERFQDRRGRATIGGVQYTRSWLVKTDAVTDGAYTARTATNIPIIGDPHNEDTAATCRDIDPVPYEGDGKTWLVTAKYSSPTLGGGQIIDSDDPLELPAKVAFTFESENKVVDRSWTLNYAGRSITDSEGAPRFPILNSAGMPFDPPLTQDYPLLVISIQQNRADYDPEQAMKFLGSVNETEVSVVGFTIQPWYGLLRDYSGIQMWDQDGDPYWQVRHEIAVRFEEAGWCRQVLDAGMYEWDTGSGKFQTSKDSDGEEITEPLPLDGSGAFLAHGGTPVYLPFLTYYTREWADLDLSTTEVEA